MKSYKDIYRFPLHQDKLISWVYDEGNNFVFQFEPRFTEEGDYEAGWQDYKEEIMDILNDKQEAREGGLRYYHVNGKIYNYIDDIPVITIRGWGNLTGIGAHHLPDEEAANIQDTFAEFIVDKLNGEI